MGPTIRLVVITAARDRLFVSLFPLAVLVFASSLFLGGAAVTEAREMAVVYAAGASRVLIVMGLVVFAALHVERLFDTREIEAILARAVSREVFVAAYWAGMAAVSLVLCVPICVAIGGLSLSVTGALSWAGTVVCETFIVLSFVLFCALTLQRALPTIFASLGFYALARLVGFLLGIAEHGRQSGPNAVANPIFETIALFVPRLDLAGQTRWLVYGMEQAAGQAAVVAMQTVVYVPLLLLACMFDLRRKNF
jgi:hypothetical protein